MAAPEKMSPLSRRTQDARGTHLNVPISFSKRFKLRSTGGFRKLLTVPANAMHVRYTVEVLTAHDGTNASLALAAHDEDGAADAGSNLKAAAVDLTAAASTTVLDTLVNETPDGARELWATFSADTASTVGELQVAFSCVVPQTKGAEEV